MHLVIGEDSEDVQLRVWGEALALSHTGDDSCYKCPMAQTCNKKPKKTKPPDINIICSCTELRRASALFFYGLLADKGRRLFSEI